MPATSTHRAAVIVTRIALWALLPLVVVALLASSPAPVDAAYQNHLIAIFNNFTAGGGGGEEGPPPGEGPPGEGPPGEAPPPMPNCLYALGLGDHYPIINDQCVTMRWRPGQAWRFDPEIVDAYQPIRVGQHFCFSISDAVYGANATVVECPSDSTQVPNEAQWRVGTDGSNYWFRNLRTDLCLRGHDDMDAFTVETCSSDPFFMFKVKTF
ncbi:hypothetical protein SYNPS1DRAFT_26923 [Syncephalis pseudoplumigaleata]|uniref:Uncharacterized protein n=1 Tax=Syncephalis pseudoplumigaleata TaxID=1712513 RepID=A0A4V1J259_9FUNG|nr:hypothetical protein SYNPS1DRAFT_26923 [Syncephalis pseudoplumigaleata]|eukprot:RKP27419.1 hypothetical protein SYNPS1DRAFT_26923 [Syncephalis pseudoplumigaleata]